MMLSHYTEPICIDAALIRKGAIGALGVKAWSVFTVISKRATVDIEESEEIGKLTGLQDSEVRTAFKILA